MRHNIFSVKKYFYTIKVVSFVASTAAKITAKREEKKNK